MNQALESLLARTSSIEFRENGSLKLASIAFSSHDILLGLDLHERLEYTKVPECRERWELACRDVRNRRIENGRVHTHLYCVDKHPVLLPYSSPVAELYFRGSCEDADRVVGQLYQAHRTALGHWFEFEDFINPGGSSCLADFLRGGFGRLAAGPQELIDRYSNVLRQNGMAASSPPPQPPAPWRREGKVVTEVGPLRALLVGSLHFVTPEVTAKKL